jgi:hypothetical protein
LPVLNDFTFIFHHRDHQSEPLRQLVTLVDILLDDLEFQVLLDEFQIQFRLGAKMALVSGVEDDWVHWFAPPFWVDFGWVVCWMGVPGAISGTEL